MVKALAVSNSEALSKSYCFIRSVDFVEDGSETVKYLDPESSFFVLQLFHYFEKQLPKYSQNVMKDVSKHFIKVYATLWSVPGKKVVPAALYLIENHLGNTLKYTTVHKRSMNGSCHSILGLTPMEEFSANELPMSSKAWNSNPPRNPLCDMSPSFMKDTVVLNGREGFRLMG